MAENATRIKGGRKNTKYFLYIAIVLIATALSLFFALNGQFDEVVESLRTADWRYLLLILGLVFLSYCVDGLIILIFCRLYTRKYKFHQGLAASLVGQFYSNVTPGSSGGQVMQCYTLKSQGVAVSNAASIFVMWFILYQSALIGLDIVAFFFEMDVIMSAPNYHIPGTSIYLPMVPLVVIGFLLNISVIFLLVVMSYSHRFHNFIIHYVIGFLGKIHLIKHPDRARESVRIQVENFKIELRRLMSNIPVLILQLVLFLVMLLLRNAVPYFSGLSIGAYEYATKDLFHSIFLAAFHQMVTGLIPLPGSAGISEFFFNALFSTMIPNPTLLASAQIIWRTATFHLMFLVSGLTAALYRSRPKEPMHYANRQTFVDIQLATYEERKKSSDTLFETRQLSRRALQKRIGDSLGKKNKNDTDEIHLPDEVTSFVIEPEVKETPKVEPVMEKKAKIKKEKPAKVKKKKTEAPALDDSWEHWDI